MVASVQELIAAANAKYQRPPSQIAELSGIINNGLDTYAQTKNNFLDIHRKIVEQQMLQQKMERDKQTAAENTAIRQRFLGVQTPGTPADPKQRLNGVYKEPEVTLNDTGGVEMKFKSPDAAPVPNSLEEILAEKVRKGEMTVEEAYKQKKTGDGTAGGPSLDLLYRMEKDKADAATKAKQLKVRGFDLSTDIEPAPDEAKKARDAAGAFDSFTKGMTALRKMVDDSGSSELVGAKAGKAMALAASLQLDYKKIAALGQISAGDQRFLDDIVYNPAKLQNVFRQKGSALAQLDESLDRSKANLVSSLSSIGYKPSADFDSIYGSSKIVPPPGGPVTHRWNPATGKVDEVKQ